MSLSVKRMKACSPCDEGTASPVGHNTQQNKISSGRQLYPAASSKYLPRDARRQSKRLHGIFWTARLIQDQENLVSRRQTTICTLPENTPQICRAFADTSLSYQNNTLSSLEISSIWVRLLVISRMNQIQPSRLVVHPFTATFSTTAEGVFLQPHLSLSLLKPKPTSPPGVLVDVNHTAMRNDDILLEHAKAVVRSRMEIQLDHEPVWYRIDAYVRHSKLTIETQTAQHFCAHRPSQFDKHIDVSVNRSYQVYYRSNYNDYIGKVLSDPQIQTKTENPKALRHQNASSKLSICDLGPKAVFDVNALHPPLRDILALT
ncbi:Hypothetical protein PHPALM_19073 [Phytophthora palmivora]|uniref:Uncharacterized protein n=1 Tax=Phytophthora palmivora TaxID=4796 RepID=A0A2P4XI65_9STRA|nr:Hypothetical protein PHPALM_19073 [Phytophthora palmivora]